MACIYEALSVLQFFCGVALVSLSDMAGEAPALRCNGLARLSRGEQLGWELERRLSGAKPPILAFGTLHEDLWNKE
jgi:hypothetical protein